MKNILIISTTEEELLSNVNDGTNRLFINGTEIPSTDWVGTGNYTATIEGHSVTIAKIDSLTGNISLARTADYTYEMRRRTPSSSTGVQSIEQTTTSHDDGGVNIVTCTLTDGTETDFEIRNGQKGSTGATGATPNIAMTASVDANTGTPSVNVTKTGTAENPSFALAFHNLKGETPTDFNSTSEVTYDGDDKSVTVSKSGQGWNSALYSKQGFYDDILVAFSPVSTSNWFMMGLSSNPTASAGYADIDYCFYCVSGGTLQAYESGTAIVLPSGHNTYAAGDELKVEYSNGYVKYFHNGVLVRSVQRTVGNKLYLDSSYYNGGKALDGLYYGTGVGGSAMLETILDGTKAYIRRSGKVVTLSLDGESCNASGILSQAIPNGYKPNKNEVGIVLMIRNSDKAYFMGYIYVSPNGTVTCIGVVNDNYSYMAATVYGNITYIIE